MNGKTSKQLHCLSIPVKYGLKVKTNLRFPPITNNEKLLKTQLPFDSSSLDSAGSINHKATHCGVGAGSFGLSISMGWELGMPQSRAPNRCENQRKRNVSLNPLHTAA